MLTTVDINNRKKKLKQVLNDILEDLKANIRDFQTPDRCINRRIKKVKKLINAVALKENLKSKLNVDAENWLKN